MHYIDKICFGEISGWIQGNTDGCPSQVKVLHQNLQVQVFAVRPREDVLKAGYTRFSGFDLSVSSASRDDLCQIELGGSLYDISPIQVADQGLIKVDEMSDTHISGWVNLPAGLRSLTFYSATGLSRADIHARADINALLNSDPRRLHGFSVNNCDVEGLYAVNINNSRIHWFAPTPFVQT